MDNARKAAAVGLEVGAARLNSQINQIEHFEQTAAQLDAAHGDPVVALALAQAAQGRAGPRRADIPGRLQLAGTQLMNSGDPVGQIGLGAAASLAKGFLGGLAEEFHVGARVLEGDGPGAARAIGGFTAGAAEKSTPVTLGATFERWQLDLSAYMEEQATGRPIPDSELEAREALAGPGVMPWSWLQRGLHQAGQQSDPLAAKWGGHASPLIEAGLTAGAAVVGLDPVGLVLEPVLEELQGTWLAASAAQRGLLQAGWAESGDSLLAGARSLAGDAADVLKGAEEAGEILQQVKTGEAELDNLAKAAKDGAHGSIEDLSSHDPDGFLKNMAKRSDVDPHGALDVVLHANNEWCEIAGRAEPPEYLARVVAQDPNCTGKVRLLGCLMGNSQVPGGGPCFAQRFANALKTEMSVAGKAGEVEVEATDGMWLALKNGEHGPVPAKLVDGKWVANYDTNAPAAKIITFKPEK